MKDKKELTAEDIMKAQQTLGKIKSSRYFVLPESSTLSMRWYWGLSRWERLLIGLGIKPFRLPTTEELKEQVNDET